MVTSCSDGFLNQNIHENAKWLEKKRQATDNPIRNAPLENIPDPKGASNYLWIAIYQILPA